MKEFKGLRAHSVELNEAAKYGSSPLKTQLFLFYKMIFLEIGNVLCQYNKSVSTYVCNNAYFAGFKRIHFSDIQLLTFVEVNMLFHTPADYLQNNMK